MIHHTNTTLQHAHDNVQHVCQQIQADIDTILRKQNALNEDEQMQSLRKVDELKQLMLSIQDIDHSLNTLLSRNRSHAVHQ